ASGLPRPRPPPKARRQKRRSFRLRVLRAGVNEQLSDQLRQPVYLRRRDARCSTPGQPSFHPTCEGLGPEGVVAAVAYVVRDDANVELVNARPPETRFVEIVVGEKHVAEVFIGGDRRGANPIDGFVEGAAKTECRLDRRRIVDAQGARREIPQ